MIKLQGTYRSRVGGETHLVTPDLSYDWEEAGARRAKVIVGIEKKGEKTFLLAIIYAPLPFNRSIRTYRNLVMNSPFR